MIATALQLLGRYMRQPDKAVHVIVGVPVGLLAAWLGLWALWLGALLAWGKERHDKARPLEHTYDGWDAFATLLGALIGATIAPGLHWLVSAAIAA